MKFGVIFTSKKFFFWPGGFLSACQACTNVGKTLVLL